MIEIERDRRKNMWDQLLLQGGPYNVSPGLLRELNIYSGAAGIYRDKTTTNPLTIDNHGVTISILHTGVFYPDYLRENGMTYHYPHTNRPGITDSSEIEATKNANRLNLPIFAITTNDPNLDIRDVHLGWVGSWDDASELFEIYFNEEQPAELLQQPLADSPFILLDENNQNPPRAFVNTRPGQQRFSFRVFQRYGEQCAVCDISENVLLDAAHIHPKTVRGTDDPRNGLVLCKLHHKALDAGLFSINPLNFNLHFIEGRTDPLTLHITRDNIRHLRHLPHPSSLQWLWDKWNLND
jgi:hypothetical protein